MIFATRRRRRVRPLGLGGMLEDIKEAIFPSPIVLTHEETASGAILPPPPPDPAAIPNDAVTLSHEQTAAANDAAGQMPSVPVADGWGASLSKLFAANASPSSKSSNLKPLLLVGALGVGIYYLTKKKR